MPTTVFLLTGEQILFCENERLVRLQIYVQVNK